MKFPSKFALTATFFSLLIGLIFASNSLAQSRAATRSSSNKSASTGKFSKSTSRKKTAPVKPVALKYSPDGESIQMPMEFLGVSAPLSALAQQDMPEVSPENGKRMTGKPMRVLNETGEPDKSEIVDLPSIVQTETEAPLAAVRGANFDGPGTGLAGFSMTGAPPDTTMAVGRNHVVAWVNSQYAVFSKTGSLLLGPVNGNSLFSGLANVCGSTNRGDPILQYDKLADRWVLSQFAFNTSGSSVVAPYMQCIAVSTTNDPTGSYYRYAVSFSSVSPSGFNDYGKLGVWTDAYYIAYNLFGGSPAGGNTAAGLCASDRTKMLAGDPAASTLCFIGTYAGGSFGFVPADLDGTEMPTNTAQGGIFVRYSTTGNLRLMKMKPNFAAGTATLTDGLGGASGSFVNVASGVLTRACNGSGGTCIAQPGTINTLDTLGDRLMYRLAYRNRGGVDSLLVSFSVDPDGAGLQNAAVRWFEIRNPFSNAPTMHQNAVYNPGSTGDRWMGSLAMDKFGNILLGYSVANALGNLKPSIGIAGRLASDPLNTMQAEIIDTTGTGSQTGTLTRWGDYSTMQVDPVDDTTFWFTTQYLSADGTFNWRTRITSYKFPVTVTTATANGNISDASKWDNGAPNSTLDVVVPSGRTVTVDVPTTVNNLTVANGATLILNANLTVQGDLSLGNKIDTGANTLSLGCVSNVTGASATNYVIGNLKRDFCGVGSYSFPTGTANGYSPVTTNVTILPVNPSSLTIKANQGGLTDLSAATSLARNWDLTETGDVTANLTFNYLPGDVNGNQATYVLFKKVGNAASTNACQSPSVCTPGTNQISITNVSSFSKWSAAQPLQPTAASVTVGGRVMTQFGRGVSGAVITLTAPDSSVRTAVSNSLGYYRFADVSAGATYVVNVSAKRYNFGDSSRVIEVSEEIQDLNFTAR